MEDKWKVLEALHIKPSAEETTCNTDKKYVEDLSVKHADNRWKDFYRAIQALERGCGYFIPEQLKPLVHKCAEEDNLQLLQTIEKKSGMLDAVMFLLCVDREIKMEWLKTNSFAAVSTLFECLRQELNNEVATMADENAVVVGLCKLAEASPEHFQYLLRGQLLYRPKTVSLLSKLLFQLSDKGWAALSNSISFSDAEFKHISFWDECGKDLDWSQVYSRAYPLLDAWNLYVDKSVMKGQFCETLYNGLSNYLINILFYRMETFETYVDAFEKAISFAEQTMNCWYEKNVQQQGALFACMAQIELLRVVWDYRKKDYLIAFPSNLSKRTLALINQYRFIWDAPIIEEKAKGEITNLKKWLKEV